MVKIMKYLILGIALFVLIACVPIPLAKDILEPSAPNGKLLDSMCGYNQGPGIWDKLELQFNGNKLHVRAEQTESSKLIIDIALFSRSKQINEYRWSSNAFKITSNSGEIESNSPIYGDNVIDLTSRQEGNQYFSIELNGKVDGAFELDLPQLYINGSEVELPIIKFKPSTSWYMATLNC